MNHITPDIHGQAEKLECLLSYLGWRRIATGWHGPEPERRIIFLGDLIDRDPENGRVVRTIRSLIDSSKAEGQEANSVNAPRPRRQIEQ